MRIVDIHIGSFGGIKNLKMGFENDFQVIYGENGYGKSTIMAFIKMMLYSKNSKSRDLNQNLRKKYTPFDGSKMNGSIRCEINNHIIRIEKEFGKTQANDTVYVYDESIDCAISIPAGMEIGEYLIKMDERTFEKTIFGGNTLNSAGDASGGEGILSRLVNVGSSTDEDVSIPDIIKDLNEKMEGLKSKRGVAGQIPKLNLEISELKEEKLHLIQRKKELEQVKKSDDRHLQKEKILIQKLIKELEKPKQDVKDLGDETGKKRYLYSFFVFLIGIAGFILSVRENNIAVGVLLLAVIILVIFLICSKKSSYKEADNEKVSEFMDELGYNGYTLKDLKDRKMELESPDEEDYIEIINQIEKKIDACTNRILKLCNEHEILTEEYESCKIALQVMQECETQIRSTISRPLNKRAEKLFSILTNGLYDGLMVDENYLIRIRQKNGAVYREWKTLSTGTANQAYLSLRIAVSEMFSKSEEMPLILDDVLANYDEIRTKSAIELLRTLNRQVILFTCHQRFLID